MPLAATIRRMKQAILRWVIYFVAILVIGPIAAAMIGALRTHDGGANASPLVSATPMMGVFALMGAGALALLTGVGATRLVGSMRAGMIAAGLVLVWPAYQSAELDDLVRARQSAEVLWNLAAEGFLVAMIMVAIAAVIILLSGSMAGDDDPAHAPHLIAGNVPRSSPESARPAAPLERIFGASAIEGLMVVVAGVLAGGLVAFLVANSPLRGQAIAAAIAGSVAAAAAGKLISHRVPLPLLVIPCALLAVIGPLLGAILGGGDAAVQTIYRGAFFPLAHVLPLDWLAGAFLGIPLGVSWAASMVESRTAPQTT